jgi:hypothetical protein
MSFGLNRVWLQARGIKSILDHVMLLGIFFFFFFFFHAAGI